MNEERNSNNNNNNNNNSNHLQCVDIATPEYICPGPSPTPRNDHIVGNPYTPRPQAWAVFTGGDGVVEEDDGVNALQRLCRVPAPATVAPRGGRMVAGERRAGAGAAGEHEIAKLDIT